MIAFLLVIRFRRLPTAILRSEHRHASVTSRTRTFSLPPSHPLEVVRWYFVYCSRIRERQEQFDRHRRLRIFVESIE